MANSNGMTARNFYTAIAAGTINNELSAYAANVLTKMDETNAKRKNTLTPSQVENEKIKNAILEKMADRDYTTAAKIAELVEITPSKASALCRMLASEKDGRLTATEVKNEKKNKVKAYKLT